MKFVSHRRGWTAAAAATVLGGVLPDHAALHGALAKIEALGLELLKVRRPHGSGAARSRVHEECHV